MTFTVTVHEPFAGTVPPESATSLAPLTAVSTPPQVVAPEADAAFTRPNGYVSVKAAPLTAVPLPLVSVMVRTLVSLMPMDAGAKDFATTGPASTFKVALPATVLAPAFAVVSAPMAMEFAYAPAAADCTLTVTVHEPPAGIVPPESATVVPLFAAVTVPPAHVVAPDADTVLVMPTG